MGLGLMLLTVIRATKSCWVAWTGLIMWWFLTLLLRSLHPFSVSGYQSFLFLSITNSSYQQGKARPPCSLLHSSFERYPDFVWVNFINKSRYGAVFWIFDENSIGNTSSSNHCQEILTLPASKAAGCARGAGRGLTQDSWLKQAKGKFHTLWYPAEK